MVEENKLSGGKNTISFITLSYLLAFFAMLFRISSIMLTHKIVYIDNLAAEGNPIVDSLMAQSLAVFYAFPVGTLILAISLLIFAHRAKWFDDRGLLIGMAASTFIVMADFLNDLAYFFLLYLV